MPAPNDLTPEEEALFAQHGVQPAGQGSEPVIENADDLQGQQIDDGGQHGDRTVVEQQGGDDGQQRQQQEGGEPKPGELGSRHRADGTFKNKEELEADRAELERQALEDGQGQAQSQGQQGKSPPGFVPHQALHESRQREAAARAQATLALTRMNAMLARQRGEGPAAPQMPDLREDPVGYIKALEARLEAFEQQRAEETQYRELDAAITQDEQMFAMSVPDYEQASDHYVQSRAKELLAFHTPDQARRILEQEARAIAQQAWDRGLSCGQMVYQLAQARGYQPGNTAADPTKAPIPARPQGQGGNGQQRPSATEVVAGVRRGQDLSRSLSGGGAASATVLNAEALLAMSDEEFEEHLALGTKGANARFAGIG